MCIFIMCDKEARSDRLPLPSSVRLPPYTLLFFSSFPTHSLLQSHRHSSPPTCPLLHITQALHNDKRQNAQDNGAQPHTNPPSTLALKLGQPPSRLISPSHPTPLSTTLGHHLGEQPRRIPIHKEPTAYLRRPIRNRLLLPLIALPQRIRVTVRQALRPRLPLHIGIRAAFARVVARCGDAAGCDVEVEQGAGEDAVGGFGLVGGDGVARAVGADEGEVAVLAHEAADVGIVGVDVGVLRFFVLRAAVPGDGFGDGIAARPLDDGFSGAWGGVAVGGYLPGTRSPDRRGRGRL